MPPSMTDHAIDNASCRACKAPVTRDTAACPSCGIKEPWIPEEPRLNRRFVSVLVWGGGVLVAIIIVFVAAMLIFGPTASDDDRDHRPPDAQSPSQRGGGER